MSITLTIDEGNTTTKMAVWHNDKLEQMFVADSVPSHLKPRRVVVSSVRKHPGNYNVEGSKHLVLTSSTPMPITFDYAPTIGSDRIAAAVGAWTIRPGKPSLVVDLGTAATFDFIDSDGTMRGGNISPGLRTRLNALASNTALPSEEPSTDTKLPLLAHDTHSAIIAGAIRGICAELTYYKNRLRRKHPQIATIITGGDSFIIKPYLHSADIIEPLLVMIGLKHISDYNESF